MTKLSYSGKLLNLLAASIQERGTSKTDRWCLIFDKGVLKCVEAGIGSPTGILLGGFNETELRRGLSHKEWERIRAQIRHLKGIW